MRAELAEWRREADNELLKDVRFSEYGRLAPKSKADYAFIQDMIHQLDKDGIMTVVLPHGVLFRGSAEGHIRRFLIEKKNYLDAVIGLPPNLFFGTSIPTCVLVFRKNRTLNDGVLFIETYMEDEMNEKPASNPDFLLKKNELKTFFDDNFELLDYEEFFNEDNELYKMKKQFIAIRKI